MERRRRHPAGLLDPHVANAGLLFTEQGRKALAGIYCDIGLRHGLPTLLLTPTWRANEERGARAGLAGRDIFGVLNEGPYQPVGPFCFTWASR